jgi:hypothetical protein
LATSCHCAGLSTMLINLALPDLGSCEEEDIEPGEQWLIEYIKGANKELYGLQLNKGYTGRGRGNSIDCRRCVGKLVYPNLCLCWYSIC